MQFRSATDQLICGPVDLWTPLEGFCARQHSAKETLKGLSIMTLDLGSAYTEHLPISVQMPQVNSH